MGDTASTQNTEVILTPEVIAQFSETEKAIVQIETDLGMLTITDPDSKEQYDKVHDGRMSLVKMRTQGIEPLKKQLKAPAIAFNNAIDEKANGLTDRLKKVEAHLQSEEDKVLAKREEARNEKERKNAEKLQERVNQMTVVGGNVDLVWLRWLTDAQFQEAFIQAEKIYDEKKRQEEVDKQKAEEEKQKQIEEQKRLDKEKEEFEKEKAEVARQKTEQEAEQKRLDDIKRQQEADAKKAQDDADARARADAQKIIDDKKSDEERIERERIENEKKPDRVRLLAYIEQLKAIPIPHVNTDAPLAKFPEQIRNTLEGMEKLIKSA